MEATTYPNSVLSPNAVLGEAVHSHETKPLDVPATTPSSGTRHERGRPPIRPRILAGGRAECQAMLIPSRLECDSPACNSLFPPPARRTTTHAGPYLTSSPQPDATGFLRSFTASYPAGFRIPGGVFFCLLLSGCGLFSPTPVPAKTELTPATSTMKHDEETVQPSSYTLKITGERAVETAPAEPTYRIRIIMKE